MMRRLDSNRVEHRVEETEHVPSGRHFPDRKTSKRIRSRRANEPRRIIRRNELYQRLGERPLCETVAHHANDRAGCTTSRIRCLSIGESRKKREQ
jgi:hypothetical protein